MHITPRRALGIRLVVLYTTVTLTLMASQGAAVDSQFQMDETSRGVFFVCLEPHRPVLWPLSPANLLTAAQHTLEMPTGLRPQSADTVSTELQVPEALLQVLLQQEMTGASVELQVPKTLQVILSTAGGVHMR
jgi:hypothetical protein